MSYPVLPQSQQVWQLGGPIDGTVVRSDPLPPPPARRRRTLLIVGAVVICLLSASVTFTMVATSQGRRGDTTKQVTAGNTVLQRWWAETQDDFVDTQNAAQEVDKVFTQFRPATLLAACHWVHDSAEVKLRSHLPSPHPRVTAELHAAIEDYHSASHMCLAVSGGSKTNYDGEFFSSMAEGTRHMQAAQKIINKMLTDI